ncbi:uncharacterized protein BX664DRAFT_358420 [Halteromyces radiatus]|uniref:uncharacterized protein n=1 Tax=Halteromyces radiatus TaxID=101107 RepID=UPI0022203CF1|nr:uncharacterized protein BX664DRAFT_358420 [Halteromyces radiatus]KAI8088777.1 hypothetical protein BX664DRAFT_358420 [Halteromyces radiatus]
MFVQSFIISLVFLFLWWILKDYPIWREKQLQLNNDQTKNNTQTTVQHNVSATQQQHTNDEQDTPKHTDQIPALPLTQYILMIPMAVFYLVGRFLMDMVRLCLYHIIYKAEQKAPVVDAWLFDKVTVWLPQKYEQADNWWTTQGRPKWHQWQHELIYHTIPTTINYMDYFFAHVYNLYQTLAEELGKLSVALQTFREKHDWRQLGLDLGNMMYFLVWQPCVFIVMHTYTLSVLFYQGCRSGLVSTWKDIQWLFTQCIPHVIDWARETRGWIWFNNIRRRCQASIMKLTIKLVAIVSLWIQQLGSYGIWIVESLFAWIGSSDWIRKQWKHLHYATLGYGIWICGEIVVLMQTMQYCVDNGLVPLGQAFMNHVLPRLSDGYQRLLLETGMIYIRYVQPKAQIVVVWLGKMVIPLSLFLERYYLVILSSLKFFVIGLNWNGIMNTSATIIRYFHSVLLWFTRSPRFKKLLDFIYHQGVIFISNGWKKMIGDLDWSRLIFAAEQIYVIIQEQGSLLFASLERTLNDWKQRQQGLTADMRAEKKKE